MRLISSFKAAVLSALMLVPVPVLAQQNAPAQAQDNVTESHQVGDWTVRCFSVQNESPCDMFLAGADPNTQQRVLSISIAYAPAHSQHVIQIAVPLGSSIADQVIIKTDAFATPKMPYRRCDQMGCYVEMVFGNDLVAKLATGGAQASLNFVNDGKPYSLKFSLNGFAGAHDQMAKLAEQKAVSPPAAGAAAPAAPAPARKR